ncbi:MAG: hypothetical protein RLZZ437_945 [Pseudomonadota bacterium]|jgi:two-component system phosphate regulon sensor histidine kinase PhoR
MEHSLATSLIAALPQPALFIAQSQKVGSANAAAIALLGHGMIGRHFALSLRNPQAIAAIEEALQSGQVVQTRMTQPVAGADATYRLIANPVAGDGLSGVLCLFEDVSDAEQIGQMRREFVANVSHELRTPLTALLGFIETLRGAAKDDPVARGRFLEIMSREAGRMNRLVSDLLQLSQVEAVERVRPAAPVDVMACLMSTVSALRPLSERAAASLEVSGPPGPIMVPGDADQLLQVFQNLIENALKYGGQGNVRVNVRQGEERGISGPAVSIAVRDEGEGIDPMHLPRLTERFYRVDSHRSREQGGTGLGLAIVKHIVNRHRGRLRIESELGQGSTFTVILPQT